MLIAGVWFNIVYWYAEHYDRNEHNECACAQGIAERIEPRMTASKYYIIGCKTSQNHQGHVASVGGTIIDMTMHRIWLWQKHTSNSLS